MVYIVLGLLGIIFGSFVNALVWRLHEQSKLHGKSGKKNRERLKSLSILKGRSMCPTCDHELGPLDLIPVMSWLLLRGKCRYCKARIPDSPFVELLTGLLFVLSYASWPHPFNSVGLFVFVFWLVFLVGFVALAMYDFFWFLLPDKIVLPLIGLAVVQVIVVAIWSHTISSILQPAMGALVIFGLFWMLYQVSKGNWIGGGDVKLAIILGLLAGTPLRALTVIFFASLAGTLVSLPQLVRGRAGLVQRIPFGPSLLLATIIVVLYGSRLTTWYQGLVLR
jgi:prepilin signal peptidase PulO-like enzyme (type II secretory pathway)